MFFLRLDHHPNRSAWKAQDVLASKAWWSQLRSWRADELIWSDFTGENDQFGGMYSGYKLRYLDDSPCMSISFYLSSADMLGYGDIDRDVDQECDYDWTIMEQQWKIWNFANERLGVTRQNAGNWVRVQTSHFGHIKFKNPSSWRSFIAKPMVNRRSPPILKETRPIQRDR